MRAVVQRVSSASVRVDGETVGACGRGLLVLVGVRHDDTSENATRLAAKIARLRIFPDDAGRFDRSLLDIGGEAARRQPVHAPRGQQASEGNSTELLGRGVGLRSAEPLVDGFCRRASRSRCLTSRQGVFGATMEVELVNDGPVTIVLDL